jgi:hypothetical protein
VKKPPTPPLKKPPTPKKKPIVESTLRSAHKTKKRGGLPVVNAFGHRTKKIQRNNNDITRGRDINFSPVTKTISSHLETFASQGKDAFKSLIRSAKVLKSSAFESLLLKATWPEDVPVPQIALKQILQDSIPAFEHYMELHRQTPGGMAEPACSSEGYSGCDDPYYMTNHKLYMKMIESDWRTTLKSLHIFHSIFRESTPKVCESFRHAMNKMKHKRALKYQVDHFRYFDTRMIEHIDSDNEDIELFVAFCTKFILHRAKHFSSSYSELRDSLVTLQDKSKKQKVANLDNLAQSLKVLSLARYNLELGLNCKLTKQLRDSSVAVQSHRTIAKDVL